MLLHVNKTSIFKKHKPLHTHTLTHTLCQLSLKSKQGPRDRPPEPADPPGSPPQALSLSRAGLPPKQRSRHLSPHVPACPRLGLGAHPCLSSPGPTPPVLSPLSARCPEQTV